MNVPPAIHPDEATLSSFGLGKLDDASSEAVSKHLEDCPDCRKRVASVSDDSFLGRVRGAQGRPGSPDAIVSPVAGAAMHAGGPTSPAPTSMGTLTADVSDLPDYEILRELGRGGMGVVYLARNKLMGRPEVLKVVGGHLVERPGVRDRFLREVQSAAKLQHKNIVTAYSAIRLGESIVLAMEYVEGDDLAKVVKSGGPLPVVHACYFIHQAALGLQHAHERGMVHRDIKPANLILAREGKRAGRQAARFRPGQADQRGPGRCRFDPRGPDARHAGIHCPRTDSQCPVGRHSRRHLQPRLYLLLSSDGGTAVPW
jgi:serine/threonine protein kinase